MGDARRRVFEGGVVLPRRFGDIHAAGDDENDMPLSSLIGMNATSTMCSAPSALK
jgi:hypothetical protein